MSRLIWILSAFCLLSPAYAQTNPFNSAYSGSSKGGEQVQLQLLTFKNKESSIAVAQVSLRNDTWGFFANIDSPQSTVHFYPPHLSERADKNSMHLILTISKEKKKVTGELKMAIDSSTNKLADFDSFSAGYKGKTDIKTYKGALRLKKKLVFKDKTTSKLSIEYVDENPADDKPIEIQLATLNSSAHENHAIALIHYDDMIRPFVSLPTNRNPNVNYSNILSIEAEKLISTDISRFENPSYLQMARIKIQNEVNLDPREIYLAFDPDETSPDKFEAILLEFPWFYYEGAFDGEVRVSVPRFTSNRP